MHTFNLFMILFIGGMYYIMPGLMRKNLVFGVNLNEELRSSDLVKEIQTKFRSVVLMVTVVSALVNLLGVSLFDESMYVYSQFILIGMLVVFTIIYLNFHKQVKLYKTENFNTSSQSRVVSVEITEDSEIKVISNFAYFLYLIIIGGLISYTASIYDSLPVKLPTHFDEGGNITNYADKSFFTVMTMPFTMVFITIVFIFVNVGFRHAKKMSGVSKNKVSLTQEKKYRYVWSVGMYLMGLILIILLGYVHLLIIQVINYTYNMMPIIYGLTFLSLALVIGIAIYTGQSGSKIKTKNTNSEIIDADDDCYWRLGLFYVNKQDPSLFVDKRFGIGMTFNFGNPWAWIILGIIIIIVIASTVLPFI